MKVTRTTAYSTVPYTRFEKEGTQPMKLAVIAAVTTGMVAVGAVAALAAAKDGGQTGQAAVPNSYVQRYALIAADSNGAVVEDRSAHEVAGYLASGKSVWAAPEGPDSYAFVGCLKLCPDTFLSGSTRTVFRPEIADPDTEWRVGDSVTREAAGIPGAGTGKTLVFGAASPGLAVLVQSDLQGNTRLQLRDRPHEDLNISVPMGDVHPFVSPDLAAVLVLMPPADVDSGNREYRWYDRDATTGWEERSRGTTDASSACVDSAGRQALLLGESDLDPSRR